MGSHRLADPPGDAADLLRDRALRKNPHPTGVQRFMWMKEHPDRHRVGQQARYGADDDEGQVVDLDKLA